MLALCAVPMLAFAQTKEFTLVTYNILRYSPSNIDARHPHFRLIMDSLQPDVLVLQELSEADAAGMFLDSVLNEDSTTYSLAPFVNGPDLDVALFYKTEKFSALNTLTHATQLRDIYQFRLLPNLAQQGDTLHVFGLHLKASSGSQNENRRAAEVGVLRNVTNSFSPNTNFLVCGDFNIYSSYEPAYQALVDDTPGDDGHFVDELNLTGTFNNPAYAQHHTQSPRTTQFNGGAHGGMDDRFDMILFSEPLLDSGNIDYIPGSMYVYGNDGQHYNKAITAAPDNSMVSPAMVNALHLASDHLPVVASFEYAYSGINLPEVGMRSSVFVAHSDDEVYLRNPEKLDLKVEAFSLNGQSIRKFETDTSQKLDLPSGFYILVVKDAETGTPILINKLLK